jgi:demethoxyubiquinone hydroxylase (CLK1/Coq7/Cat5 family)
VTVETVPIGRRAARLGWLTAGLVAFAVVLVGLAIWIALRAAPVALAKTPLFDPLTVVGVSFYVLRAISHLVDVSTRTAERASVETALFQHGDQQIEAGVERIVCARERIHEMPDEERPHERTGREQAQQRDLDDDGAPTVLAVIPMSSHALFCLGARKCLRSCKHLDAVAAHMRGCCTKLSWNATCND